MRPSCRIKGVTRISKLCVEALNYSTDVVGEKCNLITLMDFPVANLPRCVRRISKTLGLQHLQHLCPAAEGGPPDVASIVHHRADGLLVKHRTVLTDRPLLILRTGPSMLSL